jgi:hypothetical protein
MSLTVAPVHVKPLAAPHALQKELVYLVGDS